MDNIGKKCRVPLIYTLWLCLKWLPQSSMLRPLGIIVFSLCSKLTHIRPSVDILSTFFTTQNLLKYSTMHKNFFIINHKNIYTNHFPWLGWHLMGYCFAMQQHILVFQTGWTVLYCIFYISIHVYSVYGFACKQPHNLDSLVVAVQMVQHLHLQLRRYYSFAFYGHTIYHGQLMSDGAIFLYVLCHIIFLCSQLCMIYALRSCRCASLAVAFCISFMDVHTGRSAAVLIVLTFMLRPPISLCFLHGYWCISRIMHFRHYDSVATSLPIIVANGVWSVMTYTSHAKQQWWNFSQHMQNSEYLPVHCCITSPH